jgi:CelD/BcsL family acetyltransferase involved in cellulose biosynthesis
LEKASMPYTVKLIQTRLELDKFAGQWNELLKSSSANSIFLTWEWISAWLDSVHPKVDLFVIIVCDQNNQLTGIAPFYCSNSHLLKCFKYQTLRVLGDCSTGAEYPDIIISKGKEKLILPVISDFIFSHYKYWENIWIPRISSWSAAEERFGKIFNEKLIFSHKRKASFSHVNLPDSIEKYLQILSSSFRATVRRQERRINKEHEVKMLLADQQNLNELLDSLFYLHRKRWEKIGQTGSFIKRPLMEKFYRKFAPIALQKGWLALFALQVNGVIRAVQFGYNYNNTLLQLQEGFEPDFLNGVGNVLRLKAIEWCINSSITEYDFLGEHTLHKKHWGAEERWGSHWFAGRKNYKNYLFSIREIWPTGRFIELEEPKK